MSCVLREMSLDRSCVCTPTLSGEMAQLYWFSTCLVQLTDLYKSVQYFSSHGLKKLNTFLSEVRVCTLSMKCPVYFPSICHKSMMG